MTSSWSLPSSTSTWSPEEGAITCSTTCCPTWAPSALASLGKNLWLIFCLSSSFLPPPVCCTVKCFAALTSPSFCCLFLIQPRWSLGWTFNVPRFNFCHLLCSCLHVSQVLVPSLLVPSQSIVCHVCVQHPLCPQHPFLLLLQRPSLRLAAHEHLLVLGEDSAGFFSLFLLFQPRGHFLSLCKFPHQQHSLICLCPVLLPCFV